mgnify:CR=1 FL=1
MSKQRKHQTLALAGLMQAAHMVEELANTGKVSQDCLETVIHSLFEMNPKATEDVYGPRPFLNSGLQEMRYLFLV